MSRRASARRMRETAAAPSGTVPASGLARPAREWLPAARRAMATTGFWLAGLPVTAAVLYFSFPPFSSGLLILVALVPTFIAIETSRTARQAFRRTWIASIVGNCALCPWVAHCLHEFAGVPWTLGYPLVVAFSLFEQFSWPVMAALRHFVHRRIGRRPLLFSPLAIFVLDATFPKLFPSTVGVALYRVPWLAQAADFTGLWLLTALVVATNEVIAWWCVGEMPRRELLRHAIAAAVFFLSVAGYGAIRSAQVAAVKLAPSRKLRVAMVQPNVNSMMKVRAEVDKTGARAIVLEQMLRLTLKAIERRPELIFWPETSFPTFYHSDSLNEDKLMTRALDEFLSLTRTPLLFGAKDGIRGRQYNSLFLATPETSGIARQTYHKTLLLFLGERMPLVERFPKLEQWFLAHNSSFYRAGEGPAVMTVAGARLGPMICLEGLYSRFVRAIAREKVDVLVNATNDSWYGPGNEPELHLWLTAMRSIETRLPLVRATNTGITAVVDIDGTLRARSGRDREEVLVEDVPIYEGVTSPYVFWGDLWIGIAAVWVAWPLARWAARRRGLTSASAR